MGGYGQYFGNDPRRMNEADRKFVYGRGDQLNQQSLDRQVAADTDRQKWDNLGLQANMPLVEGQGGYTPEQAAEIRDAEGLNAGLTTPEEFSGNYLTDSEREASYGDPYQYFNPGEMQGRQDAAATSQRGAVSGMQQGMEAGITPDLYMSEGYGAGVDQALAGTEAGVRGAVARNDVGVTEQGVRGAIDPGKLTVSDQFYQSQQMSPEEQQRIVTGAGISAGTGYRAGIGQMERQARAAGLDPVAANAARMRYERQAAGEAGDAMTLARIQASEAASNRSRGVEGMRLGAEQDLAGLRTGSELALGGQRANAAGMAADAELSLGGQRQGAMTNREQIRMSGAQDVSNRRMGTAETAGRAGLAAEQGIAGQQQRVGEFNTVQGQQREGEASRRQYEQATNRQGVGMANQQTRFGQGMQTSQERSGRGQVVANENQRQAAEGREYLKYRGGRAWDEGQNEANRQTQIYGQQGGMAQGSTGQAMQWATRPKTWEKVVGAGTGAAAAYFGGKS